MNNLNFKFIKDEPASKSNGGTFDFYHNSIAPALARVLKDETSPHTIGLFGSWGTGKSTIIEMLRDESALGAPIFVFDAWKYQHDDSLRRMFLTDLVGFINDEPTIKCSLSLQDLEAKLYKSRSHAVAKQVQAEKLKLPFWMNVWRLCKKNWFLVISVATVVVWVTLQIFVRDNVYLKAVRDTVKTLAGVSITLAFAKLLFGEALKNAVSNLMKEVTTAAELRTSTEYEHRLNSPEQFEKLFREIVEQVDQKMIIVFDNLDRVQGDIAISMLSTIKTFLDPGNRSGLVFVIPCDADAIKQQIAKYYGSGIEGEDFDSSEYLRKVFNLVIWVPEFIGADLEDYTKKKLGDTGDIQKIINDQDVVLVINAAFSKNPREIIQFINNLVAATLVASETKVWDIIRENIAYLAKILVLKQKFPAAYALLKERWNEPENIVGVETSGELADFMSLTNRISADDAEPFIYFKTPVRSTKLKHSDELRVALTTAANEIVTELVKKEKTNDGVAEFVCDLLKKYKAQPQALLNIFNSHAAAFQDLNAAITIKKYYDVAGKVLDAQLWQSHQQLPVDYVFSLLANDQILREIRAMLLDRYIAVVDSRDGTDEYFASIFTNLSKFKNLLSSGQKTKVRQIIASKYAGTGAVLRLFNDRASQDALVNPEAIKSYVGGISDSNTISRIETLEQYKDYIVKNELAENFTLRLSEVLTTANANKPNEYEIKENILVAISRVLSLYKEDFKILGDAPELLGEALMAAYPQMPLAERATILVDMYWINHLVSTAMRDRLNAHTSEFMNTAPLEALQKMVGYWNEPTRQNLVKQNIGQLLPRLSDQSVLAYIYANADQATQLQILSHLASQPGVADIAFIGKLEQLPGKAETLGIVLRKAENLSYDQREPYYEFIANHLNSRDGEARDAAVAQAKALLRTDDPQSQKVAYDFITRLKVLNDTYKRDIGKDLLEWIKQPGRAITANHLYAFKVFCLIFSALQTPPQEEIIYMMFNILSDAYDTQTIRNALEVLHMARPRYLKHEKDYEDAFARLQNFDDGDERKRIIFDGLLGLKPKSPSIKEGAYWDKYKSAQE